MSFINKYLRNFQPYKVASHKVWTVSPEERKQILKLDWNEATREPSPIVKQRLKQLIDTEFLNLYPATYNFQLHQLLASYVDLPLENVQYFASSDSLHEYISKLYITVGDPALLIWPSYDNFRLTAQVAGANVMFYELKKDFTFDAHEFETMIKQKQPSLIYICNPNNPTGKLLPRGYIRSLLENFPAVMFLIDEAYIEFDPDQSCADMVLQFDNLLISRTMSKAFGLANIRFGYLLASVENIKYISNIRNPKNITTFAQEAAIGALSDIRFMKDYVEEVNDAKAYFIEYINKHFLDHLFAFESHANFVLVRCSDPNEKEQLLLFLESKNIFVRNISQSDSVKDCIRITIGTKDQMRLVVESLENYFQ